MRTSSEEPSAEVVGAKAPAVARVGARRIVFYVWVLLCAGVLVGLAWTREWPRLRARFINSLLIEQLGGPGYVVFDFCQVGYWQWQQARLSDVDPAPYRAYLRDLAKDRLALPVVAPPRKHVVLLQMESVDGLVIGSRKDGKPLMPFLESLAKDSIYFSNVIDNTAGGRTTDGETLVLTSLVPLRSRPVYVSQPLDKVPSLPRVLKQAGYHCWSMHGHVGHFWHRRPAHSALGYDEFLFREDLDNTEHVGWGISDKAVLHQAAQKLAGESGPAMAHIILLTNHHPYQHVREKEGGEFVSVEDDYVRSVRYVDEAIAGFFAELEQLGVLDQCLIAIYSDHDSGITWMLEPYLEQVPPRPVNDTVPLILVGFPGEQRRIEAVAGLQDVPVMFLETLGLPVPLTFTGNGLGRQGRTVSVYYGPLETTPEGGIGQYELPVSSRSLTLMALRQPEVLLAP